MLADPTGATMRNFLRDYWLWIVVPLVLVVIGLVAAWFLLGTEGSDPFSYPLF